MRKSVVKMEVKVHELFVYPSRFRSIEVLHIGQDECLCTLMLVAIEQVHSFDRHRRDAPPRRRIRRLASSIPNIAAAVNGGDGQLLGQLMGQQRSCYVPMQCCCFDRVVQHMSLTFSYTYTKCVPFL